MNCNLCGNDNSIFLFEGKDRLYGCKGAFSYVRCKNCGLVYQNPQLSVEELKSYYPDDYAPHKLNHFAGEKATKSRGDFRLDLILEKITKQSKILDVGCGSGKFLFQIRNLAGCQVFGVDISENALKSAKAYGVEIFKGTITDSPFPKKSFDVITAWSYIEHVNNPTEVLSSIFDILKDSGVFILSCPNYDSFNAKIFKDKWYHLDCPRHLYIYTPRTISKLLAKTNFTVEKINYEKSSKGLLGSLQYHFYDNNFEPRHRDRIKHSPLFKSILSPLGRIIYLVKKSDTMLVFARKFEKCVF